MDSLRAGGGQAKHFRGMGGILWKNRDNLGYAFQVVTKGVCDGCALGVAGLHDWTIEGPHLCMTRLNLPAQYHAGDGSQPKLARVADLEGLSNAAKLREMGRLAHPMLRRKAKPGFTRISWDEAHRPSGRKIPRHHAAAHGLFSHGPRRDQRNLLRWAESGTIHSARDNADNHFATALPCGFHLCDEGGDGSRATLDPVRIRTGSSPICWSSLVRILPTISFVLDQVSASGPKEAGAKVVLVNPIWNRG